MAKRALVVDDSVMARSVIVVLLQRSGWETVGAADGAEALELADAWRFDLIISNEKLLQPSVPEFVRQLRGEPALAMARVFLMVAPDQATNSTANWADEVIVKNGQIEEQLQGALARRFGSVQPRGKRRLSRVRERLREYCCPNPAAETQPAPSH